MTTHPARAPLSSTPADPGAGAGAVWVLGALSAAVLAVIAVLLWLVVPTYTAPGPGEPGYGTVDPHGYVMIFGTVLLVFCVLVLACLAVSFGVLLRRVSRAGRRPR